jgi:hypothetical protein
MKQTLELIVGFATSNSRNIFYKQFQFYIGQNHQEIVYEIASVHKSRRRLHKYLDHIVLITISHNV